jgi:hypothetical protein
MISHAAPLVPKDPRGPLRVILIGRVSTELQSLANIDASFEADEKYLRQFYSGPVEIRRLGERGSGLRTDRETIIEAEELIATRLSQSASPICLRPGRRRCRDARHLYWRQS